MCQRLLSALLKVEDYLRASDAVETMQQRWPREEATLMCRLELAFCMKDARGVKAVTAALNQKERYLSAAARQKLEFFAMHTKEWAEKEG